MPVPFSNNKQRVIDSTGTWGGFKDTYIRQQFELPTYNPAEHFVHVVDEVVEEPNSTIWLKAHKAYLILQSKSIRKIIKWSTKDDLIFSRTFDIGLESYLYNIKFSEVPGIIAKFCRYYELDKSNTSKEFVRQANYIKTIIIPKLVLDDVDLLTIKNFLLNFSNSGCLSVFTSLEPTDSIFVRHPRLKLDKPSDKLFTLQVKGKRETCFILPAVEKSTSYNFLKTLVVDEGKRIYDMDAIKVRKVLNSMIKLGKSVEDAKSWIRERCFCFKTKEDLTKPRYLWFRKYLDYEYLTYKINNELSFLDSLKARLKTLKDKMIEFAESQFSYESMTNLEKQQFKLQRKLDFNKILLSPSVQKLYIEGYSHQEVLDFVYLDKCGIVYTQDISNMHKRSINLSKREKKEEIRALRKEKFRVESASVNSSYTGIFNDNQSLLDDSSVGSNTTYATGFFSNLGDNRDFLEDNFRKNIGNAVFIKFLIKKWSFTYNGVIAFLYGFFTILFVLYAFLLGLINYLLTNTSYLSERLLFLWNCFKDFVNTTDSVRNGALKTRTAVIDAHNYLTNPETKIDAITKVILIEVKSLGHAMYHLSNHNYSNAVEWMSNFLCTRPDEIKQFFLSFTKLGIKPHRRDVLNSEAHYVYSYFGKDYYIPMVDYEKFSREFDVIPTTDVYNRTCVLELYNQVFAPESLTSLEDMTAYIGALSKWFDKYSIPNLDKGDMRNLNSYFMLYSNMKRTGIDALALSQYLYSFVCRSFFAWDPNDAAFSELVVSMLTVIKLTDELVTVQTQISANRELIDKTIVLYYEAIEINQKAVLKQVPQFLQRLYFKRFSDLENLTKQAIGYRNGIKDRKEPLCVLFTGQPEVGKSGSSKFLQKAICALDNEKWDSVKTYVFSNTDLYWEGYAQQKFVVMDDMFQTVDMTIRGHQATSLIHMVNTAPFNLPMAFDSKGQAFFNSDYILCSTNLCNHGFNQTSFNDVGLQDPEALKRRYGLVLFRDVKLDKKTKINITTLKWRVDSCKLFPRYEGKWLTNLQIAKLAKDVKDANDDRVGDLDIPLEELTHMLETCDLDAELFPEPPYYVDDVSELSDDDKLPTTFKLNTESKGEIIEVTTLLSKSGWSRQTLDLLKNQFNDWLNKTRVTFETDYYKHVFNYLYENVVDRENKMQHICLIIASLSAIGMILGGVNYFRNVGQPTDQELKQHFNEETFDKMGITKHNDRGRIIKNPNVVNGRKYFTAPQIAYGNSMVVSVESSKNNYIACLHNNIYNGLIYFNGCAVVRGESYIESCVGFHIKDSLVAVPAHFFCKFDTYEDAVLKLAISGRVFEIPFPNNAMRIENLDLILFKLPSTIPIPKELLKHFASRVNAESVPEDRALDILTLTDSGGLNIVHGSKSNPSESIDYESCDRSFSIRSPITYYASTKQGYSGALVCVQLSSGQVELIGMHVGSYIKGSTSNHGVAIPLSKEYLEELMDHYQRVSNRVENVQELPVNTFEVNSKPLDKFPLTIFKELNKDEHSRVSRASKYYRSPLFGWDGPNIKSPAKLRPAVLNGVTIDPLYLALTKFDQSTKTYLDVPDHAWDYLHNLYGDGSGKVLTWDQVLNGNSGYIRSICFGTSPGYPWNKVANKGHGKSAFINNDGARFSFDPAFYEKLIAYENRLISGEQIEVYWADCLKDELRLNEKVEKMKTRVFSTSPLHYSLLMKKYYGEFAAHLKSKCITHPVSVGLNPHSKEWTLIYNRLRDKGQSIVAGDASKFDANIPSNLILGINKFINKWYDDGETNQKVRDLLIQHIIEAYHVCQDYMYVVKNSNPTGNAITSEINSLVELLMTYVVLTEDLKLSTWDFDLVVYGDDNVIAINKPGYRVSHLAPHYKRRFNVEYTHFSKGEIDRDDTLLTVEFIGRSFRPEGALIRAPLRLDVVTQSTYWLHSKSGDVIYETMSAMFLELSHHGYDTYTKTTDRFLKHIKENLPNMYDAACKKRQTYFEYHSGMYDDDKFRDYWNGW